MFGECSSVSMESEWRGVEVVVELRVLLDEVAVHDVIPILFSSPRGAHEVLPKSIVPMVVKR